jgi:hypothetical protein
MSTLAAQNKAAIDPSTRSSNQPNLSDQLALRN